MALRKLCSLRWVAVAAVLAGLARGLGPERPAGPGREWETEVEEPDDLCSLAEGRDGKDEYVGPSKAPAGSEFVSLRVGDGGRGEELGVYRSAGPAGRQARQAHIIVHGKDRDAGKYWRRMQGGIARGRRRGFPGAETASVVLAPAFFSAVKNAGQFSGRQLAWCGTELEAWQGGAVAAHPAGTRLTSFDALDGLLAHLADRAAYPLLANVTLTGHSAGAQLVQRYAAVGRDPPAHLHVRYIHASESKYAYFTADRPLLAGPEARGLPSKAACRRYDAWPYGFERLPHTRAGIGRRSAQRSFARYATRDVVAIVGYRDVKSHGDQTCMARLQGGRARRSRSLLWYRYVNALARTGRDMTGFPGRFDHLPDWSHLTNGSVSLRIVVVRSLGHSSRPLLRSKAARPALFGNGSFASPTWRPEEPEGPGGPGGPPTGDCATAREKDLANKEDDDDEKKKKKKKKKKQKTGAKKKQQDSDSDSDSDSGPDSDSDSDSGDD